MLKVFAWNTSTSKKRAVRRDGREEFCESLRCCNKTILHLSKPPNIQKAFKLRTKPSSLQFGKKYNDQRFVSIKSTEQQDSKTLSRCLCLAVILDCTLVNKPVIMYMSTPSFGFWVSFLTTNCVWPGTRSRQNVWWSLKTRCWRFPAEAPQAARLSS